MLFAVDVGNTNITCAVMDGPNVTASFRFTTKSLRTSDEYGVLLLDMLKKCVIMSTLFLTFVDSFQIH